MEIHYTVEPEDFVAFNLSYMDSNPVMAARLRSMRLLCAGLVFVCGCALMGLLGRSHTVSVIIYALAAAAVYFFMPRVTRRAVRKNVLKLPKQPQSRHICTKKALELSACEIAVTGGGEHSRYAYHMVECVREDAGHFYIYVGAMSALIVPFRAFSSGEDKAAFHNLLCARVKQFGGQIAA